MPGKLQSLAAGKVDTSRFFLLVEICVVSIVAFCCIESWAHFVSDRFRFGTQANRTRFEVVKDVYCWLCWC